MAAGYPPLAAGKHQPVKRAVAVVLVLASCLLAVACSDDDGGTMHPTDTGVHTTSTVQVDD
jgi:hypothetical protein